MTTIEQRPRREEFLTLPEITSLTSDFNQSRTLIREMVRLHNAEVEKGRAE